MDTDAINMNTADYEELKAIPKVGEKTARAILELRQKQGSISLEYLKQMPKVPSTIWDPLVQTGIINFEPASEPEDVANTGQQKETASLDITKVQELMQTMKKMQEIIENQQKEKDELVSKLNILQKDHKEELQRKDKELQDEKERTLCFQNTAKQEKSKYIPRAELKKEPKIPNPTDMAKIIDEIAPGNIYSKEDLPSAVRPKEKPTKSNENCKSDGGYSGNKVKYMHHEGPPPPKMSTFDEKLDWRPFQLQFSHIANRYGWSEEQRLDKLIELLRDKALKCYSTKSRQI